MWSVEVRITPVGEGWGGVGRDQIPANGRNGWNGWNGPNGWNR
ncbi:hypothetical protein SGL43_00700 [Streptomyces globisporus]|uniref:Uncharacterized protein n=1 Tax=Streptomyces globisporus TaxID=1908 RepID=A0ABM9GS87_STRGL|nr:hypothetical protein SGL43_00700 [Streptomyces globisporus]